ACSAERVPCLPARMCSISSRTNSPACVNGDLPARLSRRALWIVFFSGMGSLLGVPRPKASNVHAEGDPRPQVAAVAARGPAHSGSARRLQNPRAPVGRAATAHRRPLVWPAIPPEIVMQRRQFLGAAASLGAAAALAPRVLAAPPRPQDAAPAKLKGRIHHSICRWCYGGIELGELCRQAK